MEKKDLKTEKDFLKYFFNTYIPPFTGPIPTSEEIFKDIYLSAKTIWSGFRRQFDRYSFSEILKNKLVKLFDLWEELWI